MATEKPTRKLVRKVKAGSRITNAATTPTLKADAVAKLDVGDAVNYGATVEVPVGGGGKVWLRVDAGTTVRAGENGSMTFTRLSKYVEDKLDLKAKEWEGG